MNHKTHTYRAINEKAHKLDLINLSLNDNIESYTDMMDDSNSVEELKDLMLDFLIATRLNANLLNEVSSELKSNNTSFLNSSNLPQNQINPNTNEEFKRELLSIRY